MRKFKKESMDIEMGVRCQGGSDFAVPNSGSPHGKATTGPKEYSPQDQQNPNSCPDSSNEEIPAKSRLSVCGALGWILFCLAIVFIVANNPSGGVRGWSSSHASEGHRRRLPHISNEEQAKFQTLKREAKYDRSEKCAQTLEKLNAEHDRLANKFIGLDLREKEIKKREQDIKNTNRELRKLIDAQVQSKMEERETDIKKREEKVKQENARLAKEEKILREGQTLRKMYRTKLEEADEKLKQQASDLQRWDAKLQARSVELNKQDSHLQRWDAKLRARYVELKRREDLLKSQSNNGK